MYIRFWTKLMLTFLVSVLFEQLPLVENEMTKQKTNHVFFFTVDYQNLSEETLNKQNIIFLFF